MDTTRHCHCGYRLTGHPNGGTCPECGEVYRIVYPSRPPSNPARGLGSFLPRVKSDDPQGVLAANGIREIAIALIASCVVWFNCGAVPGLGPVSLVAMALLSWWRWFGLRHLRAAEFVGTTDASTWLRLSGIGSWLEVAIGSAAALSLILGSSLGAAPWNAPVFQAWSWVLWIQALLCIRLGASLAGWLELKLIKLELNAAFIALLLGPPILDIARIVGVKTPGVVVMIVLGMLATIVGIWTAFDGLQRVAVSLPQLTDLNPPSNETLNQVPRPRPSHEYGAAAEDDAPIPLE